MMVGLFIGMALIVVVLFVVTYVEITRIWKDMDGTRTELRQMSKQLDRLEGRK